MASDTRNLIHSIRFANLGRKQLEIAEILGITDRYWNKLRTDEKSNLSPQKFERIRVIALVHRPFPFEVICKSNKSSLFARSMESYLKKVTNLAETMEAMDYLKEFLEKEKDDWGLLHLYASASFSVFKLLLKNTKDVNLGIEEILKCRRYLRHAQNYWKASAEISQSKVPDNPLLKLLFESNAVSAKIYEDYYFVDNQCAKANKEHHKVYRDFAEQASSKGYHIPAIWRDCLEQSALLGEEDKIKYDLEKLFSIIEEMNISDVEKYQVVLKEIEDIDNFEEVDKLPLFIKWRDDLKRSCSKLRTERK